MSKKHNKVWIVLVTAALLLAGGTVIFWPKPKADPLAEAIKRYQLPQEYTRADLEEMLATMAADQEFAYYFHVLDQTRRQRIAEEVFSFLLSEPKTTQVREAIVKQLEAVSVHSTLFSYLEYSEEYIRNPTAYPELDQAFWQFLEAEFKLAMLGVFYKANVDRNFVFSWQPEAVEAAGKFQELWRRRQEFAPGSRS